MTETEQGGRHAAEALEFRAAFEELVRRRARDANLASFGPHADLGLELSFADGRSSQHWFTTSLTWGVMVLLLGFELEAVDKDGAIMCAGPLKDGKSQQGTRKIKEHVQGLDLLVLDFDKGDAPLDKLKARLKELELEGAAYATFSHLKKETGFAWSVTRPNPKTGQTETVPMAFQDYACARLGVDAGAPLQASQVTPEVVKAYMVEEQGFDSDIVGVVSIANAEKVQQKRINGKDRTWLTQETRSVVAKHNPLHKSRLVLPLAQRFMPVSDETVASFQKRWQEEMYHPVARLIGFQYDPTCASIERGHYAMTRKAGQERVPLRHVQGRLLDLGDPEIENLLAPFRNAAPKKESARTERTGSSSGTSDDWRGFKAADAAADKLPSVTDKRSDETHQLAAFPCPFVHEHATSNDPSAHQCYAYNASGADTLPTVKCQSDTCHDRPYGEFLDALFDEDVKADPAYRIIEKFGRSGVYIHKSELKSKLREINEAWAVVRLGNRVRYLHESVDGDLELYDAKSLANWFSNWFYWWETKGGIEEGSIIGAWLRWQYRRAYRGLRFCPEPEGAPADVYNSYYGFTVEPRRGSWKRLLGHIYRNVCQRDPVYFQIGRAHV